MAEPGDDGAEIIYFPDAAAFETWLDDHVDRQPGVWLEEDASVRQGEVDAAKADGRWAAAGEAYRSR